MKINEGVMVKEIKRVTITPEMAKTWLERAREDKLYTHALGFTDFAKQTISRYAKQMKEGKWEANCPDPIITTEGVLLNGKLRMAACIEANTSFTVSLLDGSQSMVALPGGIHCDLDQIYGTPKAFAKKEIVR